MIYEVIRYVCVCFVFQVMGEGNKRVVTLSHRAQIRRFTSDLLRVLKSKASKQVALSEFPSVYSRVIGTNTQPLYTVYLLCVSRVCTLAKIRVQSVFCAEITISRHLFAAKPWDIVDYGVCEIDDILGEVSESTVVVTSIEGGDRMIAIPKREQTVEEIERTRLFAKEVCKMNARTNSLVWEFAE